LIIDQPGIIPPLLRLGELSLFTRVERIGAAQEQAQTRGQKPKQTSRCTHDGLTTGEFERKKRIALAGSHP
jgi:hypothetical protein